MPALETIERTVPSTARLLVCASRPARTISIGRPVVAKAPILPRKLSVGVGRPALPGWGALREGPIDSKMGKTGELHGTIGEVKR